MGTAAIRHPAVAGYFYPRNPDELRAEIRSYTAADPHPIAALGCIVPHAGYVYSGHVAGAVYSHLELTPRIILMCPNHTGLGSPLSIMSEGEWETPLGNAAIDSEIAGDLKTRLPLLTEDSHAHRSEHAAEVQLPFLQARLGHNFSFVPIAVGTGRLEALTALGKAIAETVGAMGQRVLIIASSDMNHYESDVITREKDAKAIEQVLVLNPSGLYDVVTTEKITMCGFGPAVAMLTAARRLGATRAELIKYATSGDVSGDRNAVVGYAGITVM
ncbi:MAG: AmmeMemoRadiSam system protein B [Acidobacteria bacterium]|nr:MAG: AmmeMemoRadiSam system protein B [Acidobacteriota bacterium]